MSHTEQIVTYWLEKAKQDLASAQDNLNGMRLQNAVRDAYFADFHAFSALLFQEGRSFRKHREVRAILHRDFIRSGRLDVNWGKRYDWLFDHRQQADYRPLITFDPDEVRDVIEQASAFIVLIESLIPKNPAP